ncbi:aminotransferase class I/II-fold pyridoxal phosphate-dependent enzyme [Erwiniaceae bacterium CMYE1]|nr:aminotransferase class I/II-fold pyridoxal phosphate-dependent enzyme [Erwinia phyllosphaerae]
MATGLRVGAVVSPAPFRQSLERAIRATTWNTPSVMTSIVCGWLQDGTVKRLEGLKRREARRRQAVARELLSPLKFISHPGAWFLWLPLPDEIRAENIVRKLAEEGISVSTAEPFCTTQNVPHAIRLALGSVSTEKLRLALIKIREIIEYERDLY